MNNLQYFRQLGRYANQFVTMTSDQIDKLSYEDLYNICLNYMTRVEPGTTPEKLQAVIDEYPKDWNIIDGLRATVMTYYMDFFKITLRKIRIDIDPSDFQYFRFIDNATDMPIIRYTINKERESSFKEVIERYFMSCPVYCNNYIEFKGLRLIKKVIPFDKKVPLYLI